jgi:hypothetical protein
MNANITLPLKELQSSHCNFVFPGYQITQTEVIHVLMSVVILHGEGVLRSVVVSAGVDVLEFVEALGLVEEVVASGVDVLALVVALGLVEKVVASDVVVLRRYVVVADLRVVEGGLSDVEGARCHVPVVSHHVVEVSYRVKEVSCRAEEVLFHEVDAHLLLILLVASDDSVAMVDMVEQQEHVGYVEVRHGVQGKHCGNVMIPLLDVYLQDDDF